VLLAALFEVKLPLDLPYDDGKLRLQWGTVVVAAKSFVKDNNGIKAGSFCRIAAICGAPVDEIDPALIAALDSYGKARGQVAHKSAQRTTSLLAPSAEKAEALNLVAALKVFFATLNPL
jgi:hypothetical protein